MADKFGITHQQYNDIQKLWSNHKYRSKVIITNSSGYKTVGDKYRRPGHGNKHFVSWDKKWETSVPISVIHTYENILQTQHWREVTELEKKEFALFDYPKAHKVDINRPSIMAVGIPFPEQADKYLQYLNGHLNTLKGKMKKIRVWVLVYYNQPQTVVEYQRDLWKGGNKNSFTILIGTDKEHRINWVDFLTWTEKDILKINVRDELTLNFDGAKNGYSGKLTDKDLLKFAQWLEPELQKNFEKPSFKDDYSHLSVEPSGTALLIVYIIVLLVNIGAGFFVVYNPWED